jgi:hypothetical protein
VNFILSAVKPTAYVDGKLRSAGDPSYRLFRVVEICETIFLTLYTIEAILKIFALGFIMGEQTFLKRSLFNVVDAAIIVVGWIDVAVPKLNASPTSIRALRLFKPILSIGAFSSIEAMVSAIAKSLLEMRDIILFLIAVTLFLGVIGVEFYSSSFTTRCMVNDGGVLMETSPPRLCQNSSSYMCPGSDMVCMPNRPTLGYANFDNIFGATFIILHTMTYSNYNDLLYQLLMSSNRIITVVYFVLIVAFMAFILLNLFVTLISSAFASVRSRQSDILKDKQLTRLEIKKNLLKFPTLDESALGYNFVQKMGYDEDLLCFAELRYIWWRWNQWVRIARITSYKSKKQRTGRASLFELFSARQWDDKLRRLQSERIKRLIKTNAFNWVCFILTGICIVFYATQTSGMSRTHEIVIEVAHYTLFVLTLIEVWIRFFGAENLTQLSKDGMLLYWR